MHGKAAARIENLPAATAAIVPDDFPGHVWKCVVKEGDDVAEGSPLLIDKATGKIRLVAPLEGKVSEIRRGPRRKILAVVVKKTTTAAETPAYSLKADPQSVRQTLLESGLWALMRQRPFDIVPSPDCTPRDIFISAFDSAPLAPELFDRTDIPAIEKGLEILTILSGKKPYVATRKETGVEFANAENLLMEGPHPAGNTGVQIAATSPVNKGEPVFTLNITTVARIGRLYSEGKPDWTTLVAVTGPATDDPHIIETTVGASIEPLISSSLHAGSSGLRVISGNVLTGTKADPATGFLRYPYIQITVIKEGADADEFMGWASMSPMKYSVKRTFPAFLRRLGASFDFDARIKGGRRAMILSGEYDKVFPFDIYPEYLIKAILAGDIDRMEKLGIYEVAPEDFALPEFVDTSKTDLQDIVRKGLDKVMEEV